MALVRTIKGDSHAELAGGIWKELKEAGDDPVTIDPRLHSTFDKSPALVRELVDRIIKKALADGLITHYKFGPAYLETAEPWLWKRYIRL